MCVSQVWPIEMPIQHSKPSGWLKTSRTHPLLEYSQCLLANTVKARPSNQASAPILWKNIGNRWAGLESGLA